MIQKISGEHMTDGDVSIGNDSKLTNEIQQKISKRDSISNIWGDRTPYVNKWPVRVDEQVSEQADRWVQSACVLCSNGCGLEIGTKDGHIVGVRGLGTDRVNHGRLGPKGLHGWVANNSEDRLKVPYIRENGKLRESSWEEAMQLIVKKTNEIREKYTSNAIGFYTTGQLFLEEYYTLAVIGKAGLGTPHMDGNTRLCTATSAAALKLSFGSDGQPGSYTDLDTTEAVLLVGHNMASQQTVLWTRILDRLEGPTPPRLVVIDPRFTHTAEKAEVHLAPKVGTNVAVLNGLLNLIIQAGHVDKDYIDQHSIGFDDLKNTVSNYTPEKVEEITGISADKLKAAAQILGSTKTLVSTALQGVYQSMQASAAAVQINNIHIIRGLIGKKGCGIYQMNGQPTAQNTRETGADGDLPGFRNWENSEHIAQLAKLWNVDEAIIPHWAPPTHAMQIFHYIEKKLIKMLWISGTNPAVSLPQLGKIRKLLKQEELFLIVQDAFFTETTAYADVILPAALWGEKTGCFTNVDRTVHLSKKAVDPPGEAKSDLDIFLDYAKRMDLRDKDNQPLIKWNTAEEAFEAWKDCTRGRPCDYTGMSYEKLSKGTGIQWPCNEKYPEGAEHLYTDSIFNTSADYCETYGHDMVTGAEVLEKDYKANDPKGKSIIRSAEYQAPHEIPDKDYPLWLTTGRVVYHFHTRTKTGRSKELNEAAPDAFVQISEQDAATYQIAEGDMVKVESVRGEMYAPAVIGNIIPGLIFIPFHYGYWDNPGRARAANELTIDEWDPVSKQPHFKYGAVRIKKAEEGVAGLLEKIKDTIVDSLKKE
ncbi:MAG TPA: nitrate reductase [Prolixibacteraceae bacterium]|nr:nitrate reductase [Prolixibacteraceae bacterium]